MSDDNPHERDTEMAKEKRAPGEEEEAPDDEKAEAEQSREDAAGEQENVDNHRDEEPLN